MRNFLRKLSIRNKLLLGFSIIALLMMILGIQELIIIQRLSDNKSLVFTMKQNQVHFTQLRYLTRSDMDIAQRIKALEGASDLEALTSRHSEIKNEIARRYDALVEFLDGFQVEAFQPQKNEMRQFTLDADETYNNIILPAYENVITLKTEALESGGGSDMGGSGDGYDEFIMESLGQGGNANQTDANELNEQANYILTTGETILDKIENAEGINGRLIAHYQSQTTVLIKRSRTVTILLIVLGLFLSIGIALGLARLISLPISQLRQRIAQLSRGDLPKTFSHAARDEIGQMSQALNTLVDGLRKTSEFALQIGKGNFKADYQPMGDRDVLGNALLEMRESLKVASVEEEKRKLEDTRRTWAAEGISRFNELLRQNNDDLQKLTDEVVINLVKYLEANQGGLFVYDESDEENVRLELKAAYAYNRKKFIEKEIVPGEGLVGMCFIEKYTYNIKDVPEEYMEIESGLGDSNPKNILLIPMIVEDRAMGVIELASFQQFEAYQVQLVERIAGSVASSIATLKINARTAELLRQSQRQAEEMHEQEEKMRQNMEEMQATQEDSAAREQTLKEKIEALNEEKMQLQRNEEKRNHEIKVLKQDNEKKINEIAEKEKLSRNILESSLDGVMIINTNGVIEFFNPAAEKLFGYNANEVLGNPVNMLMPQRHSSQHDDYINNYLQTGLRKVIGIGREVPILRRDGQETTVFLTVIETKSSAGHKFTGFMRDVSKEKHLEEKRNTIIRNLMKKELAAEKQMTEMEQLLQKNSIHIPPTSQDSDHLILIDHHRIGLKAIDDEHERWFDHLNELHRVALQGKSAKKVQAALKAFEEYTHYHFDNEEFYMKKYEYGGTQDHLEAHNYFFMQLNRLKEEFDPHNFETVYNLLMFIRKWLISHIHEKDAAFVKTFRDNGMS